MTAKSTDGHRRSPQPQMVSTHHESMAVRSQSPQTLPKDGREQPTTRQGDGHQRKNWIKIHKNKPHQKYNQQRKQQI